MASHTDENWVLSPEARLASSIATYDAGAASFADQYELIRPSVYWALMDSFLRDRSDLLDLGSGSGRDAAWFQARGHAVVALDASTGMLRESRRRHSSLALTQGDIRSLPFKSRSFDGVWAMASLVHMDESEILESLRECSRVLRPDSPLFVSVPLAGRGAWRGSGFGPRWFAYVQAEEVLSVLAVADFSPIEVETAHGVSSGKWLNVVARSNS